MKRLIFIHIVLLTGLFGQNLTGISGILTIPTSNVLNDGEVSISSFFLPKNFMNGTEGDQYNGLIGSTLIGFLPNLEMGLRITHLLDRSNNYLGDRMVYIKYRLWKENGFLPSFALGVHDFMGPGGGEKSQHFNSLYIVSTKSFENILVFNSMDITLGYGNDLIDAAGYQFIGFFGGASINFSLLTSDFSLLLENDALRWNGGVRITLFNHIKLLAGLMEFKHIMGGITVSWKI